MNQSPDLFQLGTLLTAALFVGVRVSGLFFFAPFLGSSAIPVRVKIGITLFLTALLYPVYPHIPFPDSPLELARIVIGELFAGLLLGISLQFVIEAVQITGQILGVQMGFSLVNILDPQTQVDTPVLSIFHEMVTLLLFLSMNVHHCLLRALARSFSYLPPGTVTGRLASVGLLLQAAGAILLVGVQLAAPVLLVTMLADIVLGFLGKASSGLPVLFLGLSVKNLLGLAVLIAVLRFWPSVLERQFENAIRVGERLLQLAR
jgi:flagellar biosynthetic protein FliR